MAKVKHIQVNELPAQLEANAIYFVRSTGEIWQVDSNGVGVRMTAEKYLSFDFLGGGYFSGSHVFPSYDYGVRSAGHVGKSFNSDLGAIATNMNSGWFIPEDGYKLVRIYNFFRQGVSRNYDIVIGRRYIDSGGNKQNEIVQIVRDVPFIAGMLNIVDVDSNYEFKKGDMFLIALKYGYNTTKYSGLNLQVILKK